MSCEDLLITIIHRLFGWHSSSCHCSARGDSSSRTHRLCTGQLDPFIGRELGAWHPSAPRWVPNMSALVRVQEFVLLSAVLHVGVARDSCTEENLEHLFGLRLRAWQAQHGSIWRHGFQAPSVLSDFFVEAFSFRLKKNLSGHLTVYVLVTGSFD